MLTYPPSSAAAVPPAEHTSTRKDRRRRISAEEILHGDLGTEQALELDREHGNNDMIRTLQFLHMAGPFTPVSPWELEDDQGVRRINACGYSAMPFGNASPELVEFLHQYLEHNHDVGLPQQSASRWRAALAHNLIALLAEFAPSHADSQVHFANSGAEAVENAIKFVRASRPHARYLINFQHGYHGLTLMALSLTPNHTYQDLFKPLAADVVTLPFGEFDAVERAIAGLGPENVAAVVLEPIQGAGGVILPPEGYLQAIGHLCQRHAILVVADEIQTGLGRTGHWFESLAQGLEPDIITLGKHLSGGMVPIGVTIARRALCRRAVGGTGWGRLAGTYSGNSLAMAIAVKSLDLLIEHDLPARAQTLGQRGLQRLREIQTRHPRLVEEVRGAGMLFALQLRPVFAPAWLQSQADSIADLTSALGWSVLYQAGVQAVLNVRGVLGLTPALTMPEELFEEMWNRVERAVDLNDPAWHLVMHTHLQTLLGLANLARVTTT